MTLLPGAQTDLPTRSTHSCGSRKGDTTETAAIAACSPWTRRGFLRTTGAGAATAALSGLGSEPLAPSAASAQTVLNPEFALQELVEGNRRFQEVDMISFDEDLRELRARTPGGQPPFAAVLSCADSRVPIEIVFDQSIGRLFVTRVAGNIATSELIASLEYGVAKLGIMAIMVLGHGDCGAVTAAIEAKAVPGQISGLYRYIRPAVDQAGPDLEAVIKANAKIQAALLRESSPVIAEHIKNHTLLVVAGYYDLASGRVTLLN